MRINGVPASTTIHELGRRIELPGGPRAVLLLHGWTGWPGRLAPLACRLHEAGFTVVVPRLPGHGTNMRDMLQTDAETWLRCAIDEYLELASDYQSVGIAGTSMGAILAAMVAAKFDVPKAVLLAPAYRNTRRLIVLAPLFRRIIPRIRGDWSEEQEPDPRAREIGREYATFNYTAMAAELYRLQRRGTRALSGLRSETLIVVSRKDATVPLEVADLIRRRCSASRCETLVVENSNHHLAEHVDRELVAEAVVRWFASEPAAAGPAAAGPPAWRPPAS